MRQGVLRRTSRASLAVVMLGLWAAIDVQAQTVPPDFDREVAPLLVEHCLECHSQDKPKAQLNLTERALVLKGGESGPALVPGDPNQSLLWQRVVANEMPPKARLSDSEKQILHRWISNRAPWNESPLARFGNTTQTRAGLDWWAWQPVRRPAVPALTKRDRNPVDAFVQRKLREVELTPSSMATPRELIRRLQFDLLGLPPTPEEVAQFETQMQQDADVALGGLVDRLLESHHHGERWARHWLDVVRFGESQGFERDKLRGNSWHYRDWVINALNDDMPYDEFVRLQVAGDILRSDDPAAIIATGFLVAGPWDEVGQGQSSDAMKAVVRQDEIEDYVGTISQTFLGLTVNCARCHDHKFDPIRQREYYQLASALAGVAHGSRDVAFPKRSQRLKQGKQALDRARRQLDQLDSAIRKRGTRAQNPAPASPAITEERARDAQTRQQRKRRQELVQQIARAEQQIRDNQPVSVYAVTPRTEPDPTWVLNRGNPAERLDPVTPGAVAAVTGVKADFGLSADSPEADRRRRLADWITSKHNPLFARVIVNRLWHYHFGAGLVSTPNDFGFNGGRPSHPDLLDWLASELVDSGWSLRHVHRLIVSSATYLQSSRSRPECQAVDAGNRWLWRKGPLRLEAEVLRDSILSVAGQLNRQAGGPPYRDFTTRNNNSQFYTMIDPDTPDAYRRTVYRTWIRSGRNHLLDAFDCPDPSTTAPRRSVTTTPIQALALMNGSFLLRMSQRFADRVQREAGPAPAAQVGRVYRLAYGRAPDPAESRRAVKFVAEFGLPAFCRVVFNSNEFVYVD